MRLPDDEARSSTNIAQRGMKEDEINQLKIIGHRGERCDAIGKGMKAGHSKGAYLLTLSRQVESDF